MWTIDCHKIVFILILVIIIYKLVTLILDKMRENKPTWFSNFMRKNKLEAERMIMKINVEKSRGRERPKKGS